MLLSEKPLNNSFGLRNFEIIRADNENISFLAFRWKTDFLTGKDRLELFTQRLDGHIWL